MRTTETLERLAAAVSHSDQEGRLAEALAAVPEAVRAASPIHTMLLGDLLAADRLDALACEVYRRSLALTPDESLRREIHVRLYAALTRQGKRQDALALQEDLAGTVDRLSPYGKALWHYCLAVWSWRLGDVDAAGSGFETVLAQPSEGDRRIAFLQARTHYALSAAAVDQADAPEAVHHSSVLVDMALHYGFHGQLLAAFAQHLNAELLDQRRHPTCDIFLKVPGEAFDAPTTAAQFDFVTSFGIRAIRSGQLELAHTLFTTLISAARQASLKHRSVIARYWLMHVLALQGHMDAARRYLHDLQQVSAPRRFKDNLLPAWGSLMLQLGRHADALEALRQVDEGGLYETDRARAQLYRLTAATLSGQPNAAAELLEYMASDSGLRLKSLDAGVLRQVGLSDHRPPVVLLLLGQPRVQLGTQTLEFPRRKTLSLLALLALHSEGMSSEDLVASLFAETDDLEPDAALRKTVYQARQSFKARGLPDPIEHVRGRYRLRDGSFDVIDLHDIDRLHEKAHELEASGHLEGAGLYHGFVAWMGESLPFDGLPEACFEAPRIRLKAMCERSHVSSTAHVTRPEAPVLAWGDAWALLKAEAPDLMRRIHAVHEAWAHGDPARARRELEARLIDTFIGDRTSRIAYGLLLALRCLMEAIDPGPDALEWTERLRAHARRHPGEADPFLVHALGLHLRLTDEEGHLPFEALLKLPEGATAAGGLPWGVYAATFGHYFVRVRRPDLANRVLSRLRATDLAQDRLLLDEWVTRSEQLVARLAKKPLPHGAEPLLRLIWFGKPAVLCDESPICFPRKKCLALLALLDLHPQGLGVDELFTLLYPDTLHTNAKKTIYTLVATTRRVLEAHGAAHLIESLPGLYRLRGGLIAHSDRRAFELLRRQADDMVRRGHTEMARFYRALAADLAERGILFDGLQEPCFEELRAAIGER